MAVDLGGHYSTQHRDGALGVRPVPGSVKLHLQKVIPILKDSGSPGHLSRMLTITSWGVWGLREGAQLPKGGWNGASGEGAFRKWGGPLPVSLRPWQKLGLVVPGSGWKSGRAPGPSPPQP